MARLLLVLGVLIATILLLPILEILALNWLLETTIPITSQTWVLIWAVSLITAIPIIVLQFVVLRFAR